MQIAQQSAQIQQLFELVGKLQTKVEESENKAASFEKFLNHSNPMGTPYILNPGRSEVYLPVKFDQLKKGVTVQLGIRQIFDSLP